LTFSYILITNFLLYIEDCILSLSKLLVSTDLHWGGLVNDQCGGEKLYNGADNKFPLGKT